MQRFLHDIGLLPERNKLIDFIKLSFTQDYFDNLYFFVSLLRCLEYSKTCSNFLTNTSKYLY